MSGPYQYLPNCSARRLHTSINYCVLSVQATNFLQKARFVSSTLLVPSRLDHLVNAHIQKVIHIQTTKISG